MISPQSYWSTKRFSMIWKKRSSRPIRVPRLWSTSLKADVAVMLLDVCMPGLDGFQLASMIPGHHRFQKTAIIFISAIHLSDDDLVRGYEMGAVDTLRSRWWPNC